MDASVEERPRSKASKSTSPRRTFRRRDARAGSPFLLVPMDVAPGLWHGTPRGAGSEKIERVRLQRLPAPDKERRCGQPPRLERQFGAARLAVAAVSTPLTMSYWRLNRATAVRVGAVGAEPRTANGSVVSIASLGRSRRVRWT